MILLCLAMFLHPRCLYIYYYTNVYVSTLLNYILHTYSVYIFCLVNVYNLTGRLVYYSAILKKDTFTTNPQCDQSTNHVAKEDGKYVGYQELY